MVYYSMIYGPDESQLTASHGKTLASLSRWVRARHFQLGCGSSAGRGA